MFNLEALTPFDFESLTKSVLDKHLGINLEIFKPGIDKGVDLRHSFKSGRGLIVQSKHWISSSPAKLIWSLRDSELPKVEKLKPSRYIVATSVRLNGSEAEQVAEALSPYVLSTGDVWGRERIEHFLEDNPKVVRSHLRLWLTSGAVLTAVLSKAITLRSKAYAEKIKSSLPTFVQTDAFQRAQDLLQKKRVVLISGPPGIGKTTLANVLCAELMADDVELVKLTRNVSEALEIWDEEVAQVFLYDDFLGRSAGGDLLAKNEDQDILDFCDRVAAAENKYFVMTTRGYLLGQARRVYERLSSPTLVLAECLLELDDLDLRARSLILYNLVWASGIPAVEKTDFARKSRYQKLINHKNYSPRLIELSLAHRAASDQLGNAFDVMIRNLDNPSELWHHAISQDLNADARVLVDLAFSMGPESQVETLKQVWGKLFSSSLDASDRFRDSLETIEGDLVAVAGDAGSPTLQSANPSIDDYMARRLNSQPSLLARFAEATPSFAHLRGIRTVVDPTRLRALGIESLAASDNDLANALFFAAVRLVDPGPYRRSSDVDEHLARVEFIVELAKSPEHERVARSLLSEMIDSLVTDGFENANSAELRSIVSLLVAASAKTWLPKDHSAEILDYVRQELEESRTDWEELSSIADLAESVGALLPETEARVEEAQLDLAKSILSVWDGDSLPNWEVRAVVDFAGRYSNPEDEFTQYEEAVRAIEDYEESRADDEDRWRHDDDDSTDAEFDVDGLMAGLAESPN